MIWYLLYPFRGTTEAPVLAPSHPLRSAFTRYGIYTARNLVTTLLISIAVATALIYPIPFLYSDDFTSGASNLPKHVWTNAQPLEDKLDIEPDVIMRSVWVHGSYMRALERDVLLSALELQDELLGPTKNFNPRQPASGAVALADRDPLVDLTPQERDTYHIINGLTNQSWFFHSPLQYWSGDREMIAGDPDIIATVNERKRQPTSVNVTLRHSVVFSGKRFEDRALVAADALVITLIHLRDSPVGRQWERKAVDLASRAANKWIVYPRDGRSVASQLYEFQFLPISLQDSLLLALAYSLTFLYFMLSLSKLRAVKSKPGLTLTVVVQIFASIMSSFTVCAILNIDLSHIPRAAYPLVVVCMSLENMFRLINAVIATRSEDSTSNRIGQAFGQTTHVALASVMQYLLLLWGLSKIVAPGLQAFCAFAAIAMVFDFFYLSTFFLAVLSVEVRRTELTEALERTSSSKQNNRSISRAQSRQSWAEAVIHGRTDVSTRVAGTVVMLGFILIANWHFFGNETVPRTLGRLVGMARTGHDAATAESKSPLGEVHQARSPTSWLRLQDHETAREVINVIKPLAHSYVARVYEPIVFVLRGSDRMPSHAERPFLPAVYDFVRHQWKPFIVVVLVAVAGVRILMNYLLFEEIAQKKEDEDRDDEGLLSVKTFARGHELDVVMITASSEGLVVSVGLDRSIWAWNIPGGYKSRLADPSNPADIPFPVVAMAIDAESRWLAILSKYRVSTWNVERELWGPSIGVDLCGQKPEGFFFGANRKGSMYPLIVVRRNGTMAELRPFTGESADYPVCKTPLISAVPLVMSAGSPVSAGGRLSILTASRRGCIHRVTSIGDTWVSEEVQLSSRSQDTIHTLLPMPLFSAYLIERSHSVDLVDFSTSKVVHTFATEALQPRSLRYFHSSRRQTQTGSLGLGYLGLAYTSLESGSCVIQTYLPEDEGGTIAFFDEDVAATMKSSSCTWSEAREVIQRVENPGVWEALPNGCIVGVRRKAATATTRGAHSRQGSSGLASEHSNNSSSTSLRHRGKTGNTGSRASSVEKGFESWEVWAMSHLDNGGDYDTRPLEDDGGQFQEGDDQSSRRLLVSELGPVAKAGASTLALGFGVIVKIITVGHERFGAPADILEADNKMNVGTRRNKKKTAHRN